MKYPRVFRARFSDQMMDDIKRVALESGYIKGGSKGVSQQEIVRSGVQTWIDEWDRVQGGDSGRVGYRAIEPEVKIVGREAPPRKRHKRTTKVSADAQQRDGRSVEDVALRNLRKHLEAKTSD